MGVQFCSIASGSNGSSVFAGTAHTRILIDAGLSGKRIQQGLLDIHIDPESIQALFITHEHADHIKGAGILSRRYDLPIYATPGTWEAMEGQLGMISPKNKCYVYQGENCVINDMCVKPFSVPHDAAEPVGYSIFAQGYKMTVATDMGHVTEEVKENITDSHILLLEANHDEDMLKKGRYPWALKQRILGENGHLSNVTAGKLLADVLTEKMKYVFLGHLSEDNNLPHLAFDTVEGILNKHHIQVGTYLKMDMAGRHCVGRMVEL